MPIRDITDQWITELNRILLDTGRNLSAPARDDRSENLTAQPTQSMWGTMSAQFTNMLGIIRGLRVDHRAQATRKSLFRTFRSDTNLTYELHEDNHIINGKIFLLEATSTGSPYTRDLQRFVAYVPRLYNRTGSTGHYAWLHYPPYWDANMQRSPRAATVNRNYPGGVWIHDYIYNYLRNHRILSSFSSSDMNAVLILPVHRITSESALYPLGNLPNMLSILNDIFSCLEDLIPNIRGARPGPTGNLQAFGASCFSSGGDTLKNLFRRERASSSQIRKIRACAFLDGITSSAIETCSSLVGNRTSATTGWISTPENPAPVSQRRLAMYQQTNTGNSDFIQAMARSLNRQSLRSGNEYDVEFLSRNFQGHVFFHHVNTTEMISASHESNSRSRPDYYFYHGHIHALFLEEALHYCRDSFLL